MAIFALTGEKGVGKDHLSDILVARYQARKHAFADSLKKITHELFPWLPEYIQPSAKDVPWQSQHNTFNLTPREIWIAVSDGLKAIHPQIFFDHFIRNQYKEALDTPDTLHIITDLRIEPEWKFLQQERIPVVKIVIPNPPPQPHSFEVWTRSFSEQDETFKNDRNNKESSQVWLDFFEKFSLNHKLLPHSKQG